MKRTISLPVIVIFRTGQLGDTLVALPAIEAIRSQYPHHRLFLLTERQINHVSSWEILDHTGWFEGVLYYEALVTGLRKIKTLFFLLIQLRALKIDHFFNLAPDRSERQRTMDVVYFSVLAGARNYHFPPTDRRMSDQAQRSLAWIEPEWRHLLRGVGADMPQGNALRLSIPDSERELALQVALAEGIDFGLRLLAICPGSKMPAKRWPTARFAELGMRLREDFPEVQLVVLGGKEDIAVGRELCEGWGEKAYTLAGKLSVYGSAAVLERCIAYVGNDTGTMHLAAIAGVPCVAIFSARDYPGKWEPYGNGHIVLRHEVPCAGCMLEVCGQHHNECLRLIGLDEVYGAVQKIIK